MTPEYYCGLDVESIDLYGPGGYHPVELGDALDNGRYRVLHKVGWGGYSTVWAAKDNQDSRYVALKVMTSDPRSRRQEQSIMKIITAYGKEHPGSEYVMQMLDYFQITGPNGTHDCLVLELLGPNIPEVLETRIKRGILPGAAAKRIAKEVINGVIYLHSQGVAHGDLHTRNVTFSLSFPDSSSESEFLEQLGPPETSPVKRMDGEPIGSSKPAYLVAPASFKAFEEVTTDHVKIGDFGESFTASNTPETLNTPVSVRPPEVIFKDRLDYRVDLWGLGCLIFELVAGQPPFDTIGVTPQDIVQQMLESTEEELPERWKESWDAMRKPPSPDDEPVSPLQEWLETVYFEDKKQSYFSQEDIAKVAELVKKLLRLEPSRRVEATDLLKDPWFDDVP